MDFCKSRKRNSTSSRHSNSSSQSSNHSQKSHVSSSNNNSNNNGTTNSYNLEYCTSSSSMSPFATHHHHQHHHTSIGLGSVGGVSCPSSTAKTIVNVGAALDEVFLAISSSGSSNSSHCSHISASSSLSVGGSGKIIKMCSSSSQSHIQQHQSQQGHYHQLQHQDRISNSSSSSSTSVGQRKRRASTCLDQDPEFGFEPSAKRQQRLPSLYQSDSGSVVSSVLPSPADDVDLVNEIDTRSSSECLSTNTDFEVVNDVIPDSPNSLRQYVLCEELKERDDDDDDDDDDGDNHEQHVDEHNNADSDDEDNITDDDDIDDIASATTSPSSTPSTKVSKVYQPASIKSVTTTVDTCSQQSLDSVHHGERTPGQRLTSSTNNTSCSSNSTATTAIMQPAVKSFDDYLSSHYDCMTPAADPEPPRQCPLPALSWANAQDVWQFMCKKDEQASCLRDPEMLDHHPGLQPRMRAILLDWLIEVCEVYKLHRETYYLAVDYLDRYLSAQKSVQKTHLQLIGITCLFVAAKVEEIYPPKIGEFAYVTDGACQESDILQHEILLLQALEWSISPVTPIGWLGVYMQLNVNNRTPSSFQTTQHVRKSLASSQKTSPATTTSSSTKSQVDDAFIYPQFSGLEFVQTAQLLDLCSLDVGVGNFPYSVIAAAAISHTFNREAALRCSGFDWQTIQPCARWMQPFFEVISEESHNLHLMEQNEQISNKFGLGHICPNIVTDDSHIIQTHTTTMTMFDRACLIQDQLLAMATKIKQEASPATGLVCPDGLLTPPASSRKPMEDAIEEEEQHHHSHHHHHQQQQHHSHHATHPAAMLVHHNSLHSAKENRENTKHLASK